RNAPRSRGGGRWRACFPVGVSRRRLRAPASIPSLGHHRAWWWHLLHTLVDEAVGDVAVDVEGDSAVRLAVVSPVLLDTAVRVPPGVGGVRVAIDLGPAVPVGEPDALGLGDALGLSHVPDAGGDPAVQAGRV